MTASFVSVDQLEEGHTLVLGTTGSGKTYQVRGMLEQLRRADRRVGAVDKLGNHWGLTLDRDGGPGLDFVIFGGKRAMVPMTPDQGAAIGRLFVERHIPAIFDISQWDADEQAWWLAAFATTVFRANDGALHLSIDEAQSFVPTNGGGKDAKGDAYRAVRLLAEQGRGNGVRLLLACQRLSRLDSTVREMMHSVVVMRQVGTIDRKAVKDLISIDADQAAMIERELPTLPVGTGLVWTAGGAELRRIRFGENATFDSSKTPRHGDAPPPPVTVSSDLVEQLRAALAPAQVVAGVDLSSSPDTAVAAVVAANGERIVELEADVTRLRRMGDLLYRRGIVVGIVRAREALAPLLLAAGQDVTTTPPLDHETVSALEEAVGSAPATKDVGAEASPAAGPGVSPTAGDVTSKRPRRATPKAADATAEPLNATARDIAELLLAAAPDGVTWNDLLLVAGRRPGSGDSRKAKNGLIAAGLIEERGGLAYAGPALLERPGFAVADWPAPDELVDRWAAKLRGLGGEMLLELARGGPATRAELGERMGKSMTSGWARKGLKDLLGSRVVQDHGGELRLHPLLAGEA